MSGFEPGDPHGGYYVDLRSKCAAAGGTPELARAALRAATADRAAANPVSIAQLGLGAWQLCREDGEWRELVAEAAFWLEGAMDEQGLIAYRFAMPHTYPLSAPWHSAMAQGEAASLLVRAAGTLGEPRLEEAARRACASLLDPTSPLVAETPSGPVLQEYPTDPPAYVLNGWISALWGVHDVSVACDDGGATAAFSAGVDALVALLPRYCVLGSWSRYDLYPHPLVNVASPFYHRLHVEQLDAMHRLAPRDELARVASLWGRGRRSAVTQSAAVARKVAFRLVRPRSRRAPLPRRGVRS